MKKFIGGPRRGEVTECDDELISVQLVNGREVDEMPLREGCIRGAKIETFTYKKFRLKYGNMFLCEVYIPFDKDEWWVARELINGY